MMYLKCTDGKYSEAGECLNACRLSKRCSPKPFLSLVAEDRKWNGTPSVTQLLKGTREAYLYIKEDKYIDPADSVFRVVGVSSHNKIEADIDRITYQGISGMPDYFEDGLLVDYKVIGSYKVAQVIGMLEDKATKRFYKSEEIAGDFEYDMQVNMYRIMLESQGNEVKEMKLFLIPRDGNTFIAKKRGIEEGFYYVDVKKINDEEVKKYFFHKRDKLLHAINTNTMPDICNSHENWEGRKCKDYCVVNRYCEGNPYL